MSEEQILPFGLSIKRFTKILARLPVSLQNWKIRSEKSKDYVMIVETWSFSSNVAATSNNHKKTEYHITAVHYTGNDWIIQDTNNKYYRLSWENVYQNTKFDHHTSHSEVNQIIKKCKHTIFYG